MDPLPRTATTAGRGPRPLVRIAALALAAGLAAVATACSSGSSSSDHHRPHAVDGEGHVPDSGTATGLPPIRHVFVIVLENEGYAQTFGDPSRRPLPRHRPCRRRAPSSASTTGSATSPTTTTSRSVSGQAPNPDNQADCQVFGNFPASVPVASDGQIGGSGCVFPTSVPTVADQLDAAHLTWKAYMQDMGNDPPASRPSAATRPSGTATTPRRRCPATATPPDTTPSSTSTRSSTTPPCATPGWSRSVPPPGPCPPLLRPGPPAWPPT